MSKWNPKQRERVKAKTNGRCGYCGEVLESRFHLDHIESKFMHRYHGIAHPDREDNLMASCASCNILKGSNPLELFRELVVGFHTTLLRDARYRCLLRFDRIEQASSPVVFYFETLSNG